MKLNSRLGKFELHACPPRARGSIKRVTTRGERHQTKSSMQLQLDEPTMAEIKREIESERLAKRLKIRPVVSPVVEYVSLLHLCYHHALKAA